MEERNESQSDVAQNKGLGLMKGVIAVAVLAIAAGMAAPFFLKRPPEPKVSAARMHVKAFAEAAAAFQRDMGRAPKGFDELFRVVGDAKWKGPYIRNYKSMPKDPWGNDYIYSLKPDGGFEIASYGGDGHSGGVDDIVSGKER